MVLQDYIWLEIKVIYIKSNLTLVMDLSWLKNGLSLAIKQISDAKIDATWILII